MVNEQTCWMAAKVLTMGVQGQVFYCIEPANPTRNVPPVRPKGKMVYADTNIVQKPSW